MKKLMVALAAVATAFGLYAVDSGFISGAGFDTSDSAWHTWTTPDETLENGVFNSAYWADTTGLTVVEGKSIGDDDDNRPAEYSDEWNRSYDGYLNVATTLGNPVGQYVKEGGDGYDIPATGLYFDALVKPTVFDVGDAPDMTADAYANAKIGIYAQISSDETETNLYVYAGSTPTAYKTTTKIDDSEWIRLTIKMIADIGDGLNPGYVVFVNGQRVSSQNSIAGVNAEVQEWNRTGSLFEGLTDSTEVEAVLFDGKGDVDEIAFTTKTPSFARDFKQYTVTWDPEKVGRVDFDPVETEIDRENGTATFLTQTLPSSIDMYWSANATWAAGWVLLTPTAGGSYTLVDDDYSKGVAQVNELAYSDIGLAIQVAAVKKMPVVLIDTITDAIEVEDDVTIDLNGQKIASSNADVAAITLANGAALVIDDALTTGNVAGFEGGDAIVLADQATATLTIKAGQFDGGVCINDPAVVTVDEAAVGKIKVSKDNVDAFDETLCTLTPPEGYKFVLNGDYFELEALPTYVNFTVTYNDYQVENVTVTTNGEAVVAQAGVYLVESNAEVTVSATAQIGYDNVTITRKGGEIEDGVFTADADDDVLTIAATLKRVDIKVIVGDHAKAMVTNTTAGGAAICVDQTGTELYTEAATWGDNIVAKFTADEGYTVSPGSFSGEAKPDVGEPFVVRTISVKPNKYYVQTFTNGVEYVQEQYTFGDQAISLTEPVLASDEVWDGKWYTDETYETQWTFDGSVAGNTQKAYAKITKKQGAPDPADDDPTTIDPSETAAKRYGDRVPAKLADVSAKELCTWATTVGALTTGEAIEVEAFLFNIANASDAAAVKAEKDHFAFTSITAGVKPEAGKDIPKTNVAGAEYNGTVLVGAFADAACTIPQMPGPQEAVFYKATLSPTPAPAPVE